MFAEGAQEGRPARGDQPAPANAVTRYRHERASLHVPLSVDMEQSLPGRLTAILVTVSVVRELDEDDRLATPEVEHMLPDRCTGFCIQHPVGYWDRPAGDVFGEVPHRAADGDHLVHRGVAGNVPGIGGCRGCSETDTLSGVTEESEASKGGLVGAGLTQLVGVLQGTLDADRHHHVAATDDAAGVSLRGICNGTTLHCVVVLRVGLRPDAMPE